MSLMFRPYSLGDQERCLTLFDMNCPEYFAPSERRDYENFLSSNPPGYELCIANGDIVGAFGLIKESENQRRLDWILLNKNSQGSGIGSVIMNRVLARARDTNVAVILITTSHKVYHFFEKFGAIKVSEIENCLGPGLHRVDMELRLQTNRKGQCA